VTEYISLRQPQQLKSVVSTSPFLYNFCKRDFKEFDYSVFKYDTSLKQNCSIKFCEKLRVQDLLLAILLELLCASLLAMRICMEIVHKFSYTINEN